MEQRGSLCRAFFAVCLLVFPTLLSIPSNADDELVERAQSILVEVPVQVTLDGEPLRGLGAENFEVMDQGRKQQVNGFTLLDLTLSAEGGAVPTSPHVSIAARRHFLLLFDLSFSEPRAIQRSRRVMREWIGTELHPWDLVAVATYSSRRGAELLLNFTSDREQVDLAIDTLGLPEYLDRGSDPLGLEVGAASQIAAQGDEDPSPNGSDSSGITSRGDAQLDAIMSSIYYGAYEPVNRQGQRHQVGHLTDSLTKLVNVVSNARGRKYVIYLSEGFDSSLAFASGNAREIADMNQARDMGQTWFLDSGKRFGDSTAQNRLKQMVEAFVRADCAIQAVDIGAAEQDNQRGLSSKGTDALFLMANETGGELYRDFNNLDQVMSRMLKKTSVTYLLTFRPDRLQHDNKFHRLKVKLKNAPKGAKISHRPGYYAPPPHERKSVDELRMEAASHIMEGLNSGDLATSVLASSFPSGDGTAYIPVLIEIDGRSLPERIPGDSMTLEIYAYAIDAAGSIRDSMTQLLTVDLSTFEAALRESGLKFFGDLELPPGGYSLRVLVREARFGLFSSRALPLEVPDFSGEEPTVLPPFFPEPRGKWLLARESVAEDDGRPFPFMVKDEPYLPAAMPEVESHTEARVYLVVYDLGTGPIDVTSQVLDPLGTVRTEPRLMLIERTATDATGDQEILLANFRPGELDEGDYTLIVTVANERTGLSQTNSIPFRVVQRERATEAARLSP